MINWEHKCKMAHNALWARRENWHVLLKWYQTNVSSVIFFLTQKLYFFRILYFLCFFLRLDKLSLDIITVLQRWFIKYVSNWPYWIHLDYGWKMKQKKNSRIFPKGKWKEQRTRILKVFFKLFAIQTVSFIFIFYFVSSFCFVCAASISSFI